MAVASEVPWHARAVEDASAALDVDPVRGHATEAVARRLAREGPNVLPEPPRRSLWRLVFHQFASPLILLLFGAAALALLIGERTDAVVIAVVVVLNAGIGAFQEGRAERSLAALRKLGGRTARVVRDGREEVIDAAGVVGGDILVVGAGDAIVADARVLDAAALQVAEAALTGESVPVPKGPDAVAVAAPPAERTSMLFAGTWVTAGRGRAVVVATGMQTELGHIARLASAGEESPTPLQRRITVFGRTILAIAIGLFVLVLVIGGVRGVPPRELLLVAISQIVGLVPEGLPVAMTVALAVGVQRMARRRAIVRRLSAVEALGATTVICADKTGTLTRNEMTVTTVVLGDGRVVDVEGIGYAPAGRLVHAGRVLRAGDDVDLDALLRAAVLCNDASVLPPSDDDAAGWRPVGDPTEVALVTLALKAGCDPGALRTNSPRRGEQAFDATTKRMTTEHDDGAGGRVVFMKGAPETVLPECAFRRERGADVELDDEARIKLRRTGDEMAGRALRVLAIATVPAGRRAGHGGSAASAPATFLGLVGQLDPPREEVGEAIARCRAAGIRPVMITGDHKATGIAVARTIGIIEAGESDRRDGIALDGTELTALDDAALAVRLPRVAVFARVQPAQKLRIVEALQAQRHVVAMTGDGVNDAPALVRADVGVAMGRSGTEVARDAARIVLVDDNFATIVAAIEEGRVVYRNIKKALLLLLSTAAAEVLVLLLALLLGRPPPFAAVQILWNNLVTEGLVTANLIFEPAEGDEMRRPPIAVAEPLLDRQLLARLVVMTLAITVVTLGWWLIRLHLGVPAAQVQTETFTLLAVCEWFNALNCRSATRSVFALSLTRNPWLLGGLLVGNALQILVVFAPPMQGFFRTTPFGLVEAVGLGAAASTVLWVEELRKLVVRRRASSRGARTGDAVPEPPFPRESDGSRKAVEGWGRGAHGRHG